jgi:hypothetical protein
VDDPKRVKRASDVGAYLGLTPKELIAAIEAFISQSEHKPLRWTKSADDILATIERFCRCVRPRSNWNRDTSLFRRGRATHPLTSFSQR